MFNKLKYQNTTALLSIISFLISVGTESIHAQGEVKPSFTQIEYMLYDLNSPRTSVENQPIVQAYIRINQNGEMYIIHNVRGRKYYSFQLNDEEIKALNKVFNEEAKLKRFVLKKKQDKNVFYAGYYYFLKYEDSKNQTQHLSFIGGQLTEELNTLLERIFMISNPYSNKNLKAVDKFEIDEKLISEAYSGHLKNKNLPPIVLPPPPAK